MNSTPVLTKRQTLWYLAILILVVAAIRVPLLNIPFERDEGEYAYIGWRLGFSELPYRDWIDQKPPAIFWVYQFASMLPFNPIAAVHFMGLLWSAASACALFFLALRFMKPFWALAAAVQFALLSGAPGIQGTAANTELFMLFPLILSQIIIFQTPDHRRRIILMIFAGVLTGFATAFKQVAVVNWFLLIAFYPALVPRGKRLGQTVLFASLSAVGVALVWGLIAAYFLARHGFADFIYNVFTHNLEYVKAISWRVRLAYCQGTLATLWSVQAITWFFSLTGFIALAMAKKTKWLLFLSGWLLTSLIGVSASGYYFPHYFQQLLPVLAVTAALGMEALADARCGDRLPAWCRRTLLCTLVAFSPVIAVCPFIFSYTPAQAVDKIYPGNSFAEMCTVGKRIAGLTQPTDRVFIFGAEPEVFFYSQRVSATRFIFLFPLYGPYQNALDKQIATSKEVTNSQPRAALYLPNGLFFVRGSEQYFTRWSRAYLRDNFRVDSCITIDSAKNMNFILSVSNQPPLIPDGQDVAGVVFGK